jgi:hypothetical protein
LEEIVASICVNAARKLILAEYKTDSASVISAVIFRYDGDNGIAHELNPQLANRITSPLCNTKKKLN